MSLLDRFLNPVWHKASKLDINRQRALAMVIVSYEACRKHIESQLITPVESFLRTSGIEATAASKLLASEVKVQLVDEAFIGLLRCGKSPDSDPTGKVPAQILRNLPSLLGIFALADINHRLNRTSPNVLDQTQYSTDPDEARTQVLTKWMQILDVSSPHFVTRANASGFAEAWSQLAISMLSGMLKGFLRTPDDVLFANVRRVAAEMPVHQVPLVENLIERLAQASFDRGQVSQRTTPYARKAVTGAADSQVSIPTYPDGVEFLSDGKAVLHLPLDADVELLIRQMALMVRRHLLPREMNSAAKWVARVTEIPIKNGDWQQEHEDAFVRGFERFIWEGNASTKELHESLATLQSSLRKKHPVLAGSPIDVDLDEEMRRVYRRMFGGESDTRAQVTEERTGAAGKSEAGTSRWLLRIPAEMLERGRFHRENNFRSIGEWEKRMVSEFGQNVIKLLPDIWDTLTRNAT